jgi:hypothetical protein
MSRKGDPIPRREVKDFVRVLQPHGCLTAKDENPFVPILIIPKSWRGGLAVGHNPFDAKPARLAEGLQLFALGGVRERAKEFSVRHRGHCAGSASNRPLPADVDMTGMAFRRYRLVGTAATIFSTAFSILRALLRWPPTTAVPVPRKTSLSVRVSTTSTIKVPSVYWAASE